MTTAEHGGKPISAPIRISVITCSDTRTPATDTSGNSIVSLVEKAGHVVHTRYLIPDEPTQLLECISECLASGADFILVNGGTGISKRDNTFEALSSALETPLPGFGELFRSLSYQEIGAASMLSRAIGGIIGQAGIFSMPGSTNAVLLAMNKLILPQIAHLYQELRK